MQQRHAMESMILTTCLQHQFRARCRVADHLPILALREGSHMPTGPTRSSRSTVVNEGKTAMRGGTGRLD